MEKINRNFVKLGSEFIYTSDPTFLPISINKLSNIKLKHIPVDAEVIPYDSIQGHKFYLRGIQLSIVRISGNTTLIGSIESKNFQVAVGEKALSKSCSDFVKEFFQSENNVSIVNTAA